MDKWKRNRSLMIVSACLVPLAFDLYWSLTPHPGVDGVPMAPPGIDLRLYAWVGLILSLALLSIWIVPQERRRIVAMLGLPPIFFLSLSGLAMRLGWWAIIGQMGWMVAVTLAARFWPEAK